MNHYFIRLNTSQETFSYHNDKYNEIYDVLWHISTKKSIFVGGRNLISLPFQLQIRLVDFQLRKFEYE